MRFVALVLLVLAVAPVTGAAAAPATREEALNSYLDMLDATAVESGWTGDTASCALGAESPASIAATLDTLNRLRDFAGLGPVSFDADLNQKALAAALMMRAADSLSHTPEPGWPCYTEAGREGAGRSNLFLGRSGPPAMIGYVDDGGVDSLGHRRWVLDPRGSVFGTGSTGTTNALLVIGGPPSPGPVPALVAWPPPGFTPWPLVFADWSAAVSSTGSVDLSQASVAVTVDGQPRSVSGVTNLGSGYGTGETLKWNVGLTNADREDRRAVAVTISNVLVDGVPQTFAYGFEAFPASPPLPPAFSATRSATSVKVTWAAAAERGVPVTGYRVVGTDGGSGAEFDQTVGPEARELTVPYAQALRTLAITVIPLSRAGSPDVEARFVAPPPRPPRMPVPGSSARAPANLVVARPSLRGGRLRVRATITRRANGGRLRLKVAARGRAMRRAKRIVSGRAKFSVRLSRYLRRHRPLRVTVGYAGSEAVAPDTDRWTYR